MKKTLFKLRNLTFGQAIVINGFRCEKIRNADGQIKIVLSGEGFTGGEMNTEDAAEWISAASL